MKIRFKKLLPNAVTPTQGTEWSAGFDLTATSRTILDNKVLYGTGIAVEIPLGYVGLVFPRSSVHKTRLRLTNSVGVIDADYRGEIKAVFDHKGGWPHEHTLYAVGERICQLLILPIPMVEWEESEVLSQTGRGSGGYGSTGR